MEKTLFAIGEALIDFIPDKSGCDFDAVDTTGAGDGFCGSFLYNLYKNGVTAADLKALSEEKLGFYLDFSNKFCGISVQKKGAIESYPEKI